MDLRNPCLDAFYQNVAVKFDAIASELSRDDDLALFLRKTAHEIRARDMAARNVESCRIV